MASSTAPSVEPFADFPVIDLTAWRHGDAAARAAIAQQVDHALTASGFLLVTGHGIDPALTAAVREGTRTFFHSATEVKHPYRSLPGTPGWNPPGIEANGYASGAETPPDLKESLTFGSPDDGAVIIGAGGPEPCTNVYPAEVPELATVVPAYLHAARALTDDLLELMADALGAPRTTFTSQSNDAPYSMMVTWYPSYGVVGDPAPDQFRIGPHTDFGTITVLDRQRGVRGLQVQGLDGAWIDAPHVPGSLTINIGDLMARWTGGRWRSNMHRSLPPTADAADEELISLVFFMEADMEALITPLAPPHGGDVAFEPVVAVDYLIDKMVAITMASSAD